MPRRAKLAAKFRTGTGVYAKWPGSGLYYQGKVLDVNGEDDTIDVKFEFQSEPVAVKSKDVHGEKVFAKRSRSTSPARTPKSRAGKRSRSKSPSRAKHGRSRSPGRPQKTIIDKPEPQTQEEIKVEESPVKSESPIKSVETIVQKDESYSYTSTSVQEEKSFVTTRRVTRSVTRALQENTEEEVVTMEAKKTIPYEFGGPFLVTLFLLLLPAALIGLQLICTRKNCTVRKLPKIPPVKKFFNWKSAVVVVSWFIIHALLYLLPFGKIVKGRKLDGSQLAYRLNGFFTLTFTLLIFGVLTYFKKTQKAASFVSAELLSLTVSAICLSFLVSIVMFIKGVIEKKGYSESGNSGCLPYDFFVGRQLNPRTWSFDWKHFCYLRYGAIGWVTINFLLLLKQYESGGKTFNIPMLLVVLFQLLYVADALIFEESYLLTKDTLQEGFGFMLSFRDLALIPFFYTSQVRYLSIFSSKLEWHSIVGILLLKAIGYYIYRKSRLEKDRFRDNPREVLKREVKVVYTSDQRHLLADGWWGTMRHPNYLGDIIMAISWALPCGFTHVVPWFYTIFLTGFLLHRAYRDDHSCSNKYGLSWLEYKKRVPNAILPSVFKRR